MVTIIFSHPWHGSFNYAILEAIKEQLDTQKREYQVIDLVADGFNPLMTAEDLKGYSRGESQDPLVNKYIDMLEKTDELILLFPIWWGMMPADLKGFFDKVLLVGRAYSYTAEGAMIPGLQIGRTLIITTSQSPSVMFGQFIEGYFVPVLLNTVGITGTQWENCDRTAHGPEEHRAQFLKRITTIV